MKEFNVTTKMWKFMVFGKHDYTFGFKKENAIAIYVQFYVDGIFEEISKEARRPILERQLLCNLWL